MRSRAIALLARARPPLKEFLEQPVALPGRKRDGLLAAARKELVELLALALRHRVVLAQPFLRAGKARPPRQHGRQIGFLPFRMARRLLEFGELGEEIVDELLD